MAGICLCLTGKRLDEDIDLISRYQDYLDFAELRADFLEPSQLVHIDRLPKKTDIPLILTLRRPKEGGRFEGSEADRRRILLNGLAGGYRFVDLEEDVDFPELREAAFGAGTRIIRSLHDFDGLPGDLDKRLKNLARRSGELPKIAVNPGSTGDVLKLLDVFDATRGSEKILLGMGPWGFFTRVLATKLGSFLTYCSPEEELAAPGHIDPKTLAEIYRFRSIGENSTVYGIIGNPVMHTRSPWIHNPGLSAIGVPAVYVPFQVDDLPEFVSSLSRLDIGGLSVTIPYKRGVISLLKEVDQAVRVIGSCNTMYRLGDHWAGTNTDADGIRASLEEILDRSVFASLKATVIGAGGTARTVVYTLKELGAQVCILNRTPSKAAELARSFDCEWGELAPSSTTLIESYNDLIFQTSSVGMHPNEDADPIEFYDFRGHEAVVDAVYAPEVTRLLTRARDAGCRTVGGKSMLFGQAYRQFLLFTGVKYPEEVRDRAAAW